MGKNKEKLNELEELQNEENGALRGLVRNFREMVKGKQNRLTPGKNVTIENDVISAEGEKGEKGEPGDDALAIKINLPGTYTVKGDVCVIKKEDFNRTPKLGDMFTAMDISSNMGIWTVTSIPEDDGDTISATLQSYTDCKGLKGDKGEDGEKGETGEKGEDGADGATGLTPKFNFSSTYTTIGQTATNPISLFNRIPKVSDIFSVLDGSSNLGIWEVIEVNSSTAKFKLLEFKSCKGDKGDTGEKGDTGQKGNPGEKGDPGPGVKSGGSANDVLMKNSSTDYDTKWEPLTTIWTFIKAKTDALYSILAHTHTVSNITDLTVDATELNYLSGVTENIQDQLDDKSDIGHTHSNATTSNPGFMSKEDKTKLNGIETGANKTIVDSSIDSTSTNPVQNKVINTALNTKSNVNHTHTVSDVTDLTATATEINYTDGVTSNIQDQLDSKSDDDHRHNNATSSEDGFMSKEDYSKLNGIESGANKTIVDATLDSTSTNPVQNKIVKAAIDKCLEDSKEYTDEEIVNAHFTKIKFVSTLPSTPETNTIYLVASSTPNVYKQYIYDEDTSSWKEMGTTEIDLSDYYKKSEINTLLSEKSDTNHLHTLNDLNGTLSIAKGGTGATTATEARNNLDAASSSHTHSNATTTIPGFMSKEDKTKLNGIESGANKTTIDSSLSSTSTNPVQNKIINTALSGKASTSHVHSTSDITSGILSAERGGTGKGNLKDAANNLINNLETGSSMPADGDYFISQYVNGGTTTTTYHRRPISVLWSYIKSKADSIYASISHSHSSATTSTAGFMSKEDKTKLDGIASGATKVIVDSALNATSTNPVQNKVINSALAGKASTSHTHTVSNITDLTASATELNYTDGVTSNIQTQLDEKSNTSHGHNNATQTEAGFMSKDDKTKLDNMPSSMTIDTALSTTSTNAVQNKAIAIAVNGKAATTHTHAASDIASGTLPISRGGTGASNAATALTNLGINATASELNYTDGVTSNIQTQLNGKAATSHGHNNATSTTSGFMSASDKSKLDNLDPSGIVVDDSMSTTSVNPVQNKVITAAIATKADTDHTHSAATTSTNGFMSSSDKTKLNGIESGATKTTIDSVLSSTSTNPVQNKVINSALAGKASTSHSHSDSTTSASGFMSSADKTKLNGIATGATKTIVDASLSSTSTNPVQNKVINSALAGKASTSHTHSDATQSASGFMSASDKTKLDGLSPSGGKVSTSDLVGFLDLSKTTSSTSTYYFGSALGVTNGGTGCTTEAQLKKARFDHAHPVGSVYLSFSQYAPSHPSNGLSNAVWEQVTSGVLRAGNDTGTGGADTHNILNAELPKLGGQIPVEGAHNIYAEGSGKNGCFWDSPETLSEYTQIISRISRTTAFYNCVSSYGAKAVYPHILKISFGNSTPTANNNIPKYQNLYVYRRTS